MPLITAKTSVEISKEKEVVLKEKLGKAIELIGKSESWLMISGNVYSPILGSIWNE